MQYDRLQLNDDRFQNSSLSVKIVWKISENGIEAKRLKKEKT